MQSMILFALCFKGTLLACGQVVYRDFRETLVKTWGKAGSGGTGCLRTSYLHPLSLNHLSCFSNKSTFSWFILLLLIHWQKFALLLLTFLSTYSSSWALAFLTQSLHDCPTFLSSSSVACPAPTSSTALSNWSSVVIYLLVSLSNR